MLTTDTRVLCPVAREGEADLYTFSDVSVVCGRPALVVPADTLMNPALLAEIVSESTEAYDRGTKFRFYRQIESLRVVLFVAQDRRLVETFERAAGDWRLRESTDALDLPTLGVRIPLDALYANVDLAGAPPLHPGGATG